MVGAQLGEFPRSDPERLTIICAAVLVIAALVLSFGRVPDIALLIPSTARSHTRVIAPCFVRLQGAPVLKFFAFLMSPKGRAEHRAFHRARGATWVNHVAAVCEAHGEGGSLGRSAYAPRSAREWI